MTKQFKPIAMRCNQEQFETVKDKIVKRGGKIVSVYNSSWGSCPYLTNNFNGATFEFGNTNGNWNSFHNRTVYETFDKDIFLEACGWKDAERKIIGYKRNPKMDVTAEQLAVLLRCGHEERGVLFIWVDSINPHDSFINRAKSLNIIGENKMLVPVYEEEEIPSTDKTYTLEQYNTFNEMQKLALNEFVLVHKSKVK